MSKLYPPCSYQGGKQRLAAKIVDIIFSETNVRSDTKFFDLCCGSGAFSIELFNRGVAPENIIMIDAGLMGLFWEKISSGEFNLDLFRRKIDELPDVQDIQSYLKGISSAKPNEEELVYDYLLLQAGAFGSKQIWVEDGRWKNCSFRSYWMPTETSNRKSPVNPMMPMPEVLYDRVKDIVSEMSGKITAHHGFVENYFDWYFDADSDSNAIVYVDPPYRETAKYKFSTDISNIVANIWNNIPIFISEGCEVYGAEKSWLLSSGRSKGNMNAYINKAPTQEWLSLLH